MTENKSEDFTSIMKVFSNQSCSSYLGNYQEAITCLKTLENKPDVVGFQSLATITGKNIYIATKKIGSNIPNVEISNFFKGSDQNVNPILLYKDENQIYHLFANQVIIDKTSSTVPLINSEIFKLKKENLTIKTFAKDFQISNECGGGGHCGPLSLQKGFKLYELKVPKKYKTYFGSLDYQKLRQDVVDEQINKGKVFFEDSNYYWREDDLYIASGLLQIPIIVIIKGQNELSTILFNKSQNNDIGYHEYEQAICLEYQNNHYKLLTKSQSQKNSKDVSRKENSNNSQTEKAYYDFSNCFSCFSGFSGFSGCTFCVFGKCDQPPQV